MTHHSTLTFAVRSLFHIPPVERAEFCGLPLTTQREIELRMDLIEAVHISKNREAEYTRLAAVVGDARGYSAANLKRLYRRFVAGGKSWRSLVPLYNAGKGRGLPAEFREYWRAQVMSNQRAARPMWKRLMSDWQAGKDIPGYGTWMDHWQKKHAGRPLPVRCPGLPDGWSYENLMNYAPDEVEISLVRDGFKESHHLISQIQRSREGMLPLALVAFDDFQLDFRAVSLEHLQVAPLRGLGALDVGMAVLLDHAVGPCLIDDSGHRKAIAYRDMKMLIFRLLTMTGYPADYQMTLLVENETATLTEADAKFLARVSNGQIKVQWTAMAHRSVLAAGHREDNGSPWEKGWKESFINLLHNELGDVRGQFGLDPVKGKAGDYQGRLKETEKLLTAAAHLPAEIRGQLTYQFPTVPQALVLIREAIARMNNRTEHKLEGFEQIPEWRLDASRPWEPLATMPEAIADHVEMRKRMETPMERLARRVAGQRFIRLPPAALWPLLEEKKDVAVTKPYEIIFTAGGKKRTFRNADLREIARTGDKFTAHWAADSFDRIFLVDTKGGYVGEAYLVRAVNPLDVEALAEAQASAAQINNTILTRVRETMGDTSRQRVAETEANGIILARAAIEAARQGDTATEANRLAQAMATGGEAVRVNRATSTKRSTKKRNEADKALSSIAAQAATMTGL